MDLPALTLTAESAQLREREPVRAAGDDQEFSRTIQQLETEEAERRRRSSKPDASAVTPDAPTSAPIANPAPAIAIASLPAAQAPGETGQFVNDQSAALAAPLNAPISADLAGAPAAQASAPSSTDPALDASTAAGEEIEASPRPAAAQSGESSPSTDAQHKDGGGDTPGDDGSDGKAFAARAPITPAAKTAEPTLSVALPEAAPAPQVTSAASLAAGAPAMASGGSPAPDVARPPAPGLFLAAEIHRQFDGRSTSFDVRMDPPELGEVEVRLEVSRDRIVTAVIGAERPETLSELMRSARDIERALAGAGLDVAAGGLQFEMRSGPEGNARERASGGPAQSWREETASPSREAERAGALVYWTTSTVDIWA